MVYRDPANIEQQQRVEDEIEAATIALEVAVLAIIARRLGKLEDASIVDIYASMPSDIAQIRSELEKGVRNIQQISDKFMQRMAKDNDEWAKRYYEAMGVDQISAADHPRMRQIIEEYTSKANDEISVKCRSSVIEILNESTGELLPIERAYRETIEKAASAMAAGKESGERAIAEAVRNLSKSGLRVVYRSGVTRNLYSAVNMNVMDSYRVGLSQLREIQGMEFGADGVEVSAHALCAEDHLPYQGRQFTLDQYQRIQDNLPRPLVDGANCGHIVFPVILGISAPAYSSGELNKMNNRSTQTVTVEGLSGKNLTMTRYEASQYQRQIETSIRKANEQVYLIEQSGGDASALKSAIKARTAEYRRISAEAGLSTRMERTRAYVQK